MKIAGQFIGAVIIDSSFFTGRVIGAFWRGFSGGTPR